MLIEKLNVGYLQTNCYLVGCEATHIGAIIDPGDDSADILAAVKRRGLDVRLVLFTHAHFDHIMAAEKVLAATGAKLAFHPADSALFDNGGGASLFGFPLVSCRRPDIRLNDGDKLVVGEYTLETRFAPGHTPGHVVFYEARAGVLFTGDVLFAGSIGRTDLPGGNYETLMNSISHQLMVLPDETVVYPGHGPQTTIGRERRSNPFL